MFIKENLQYARDIEGIVRQIQPDEIQINTPLRPCSIEPLGREELSKIKNFLSISTIFLSMKARKNMLNLSATKTR